jgi:signal transduction histidine kinase
MRPVGSEDFRFLVIAPIGRDGELICNYLSKVQIPAECAHTAVEAAQRAQAGVAGFIVAEESLDEEQLREWRIYLRNQPSWSDPPFVLLGAGGSENDRKTRTGRITQTLGNVTVLDRPVRIESLLSTVNACLRARQRQYEVRDAMERQHRAEEALRESERSAVAGRLAALIAHEINNPLESITNLVYLISTATDLDMVRQFSQMAEQELQRITEIVNQTLRFRRAPTHPEPTDIAELVDSSLALFRAKIRNSEIEVDCELLPAFAVCSPGEMRQAVINLLANAIDAMPRGGHLSVRVRQRRLGNGVPCVQITIADTGSGIPEDVRSSLFKQFFTTKGSRGTGLGLWLTKDIVAKNNGSIRYKTSTNTPTGTVFSIFLRNVVDTKHAHEKRDCAETLPAFAPGNTRQAA